MQTSASGGQHRNAQSAIGQGLQDGLAKRDYGGTRGEDIVHQKNVFAPESIGTSNTENALDIIPTLDGVLTGLAPVVAVALDTARIYLNTKLASYAACNIFRLIVASPHPASPMQWHGHNNIDIGIEARLAHQRSVPTAKTIGRKPTARVFETMHSLAPRTPLDLPEQGRGVLHGQ